jgi:hypothetical protein
MVNVEMRGNDVTLKDRIAIDVINARVLADRFSKNFLLMPVTSLCV